MIRIIINEQTPVQEAPTPPVFVEKKLNLHDDDMNENDTIPTIYDIKSLQNTKWKFRANVVRV